MKICSMCHQNKSLLEFYSSGGKKNARCRSCVIARVSAWRAANPEKRKAQNRKRYLKHRDRLIFITGRYYAANKERAKARNAKRYQDQKERILCLNALWRAGNADHMKRLRKEWASANGHVIASKTRARQVGESRATPLWANQFFIAEIYDLARLRTKHTGIKWDVDHIVPLVSKSVCGLHTEHNLQVIPASVNVAKSNRWWPDMPQEIRA